MLTTFIKPQQLTSSRLHLQIQSRTTSLVLESEVWSSSPQSETKFWSEMEILIKSHRKRQRDKISSNKTNRTTRIKVETLTLTLKEIIGLIILNTLSTTNKGRLWTPKFLKKLHRQHKTASHKFKYNKNKIPSTINHPSPTVTQSELLSLSVTPIRLKALLDLLTNW